MIIKKRLHKEFSVTVDGIEFTFRMPTHTESMQFGERTKFSERADLVMKTLLRVSEVDFDDGTKLTTSSVFELEDDLLFELYTEWAKAKASIQEQHAKEQAEKVAFTSGSEAA